MNEMVDQTQAAWAVAAAVPDPELPCVTVAELGILRAVVAGENGTMIARVTPTYSGCPAVQFIEEAILEALTNAGFTATIERVISPPWTTDWISDAGLAKLKDYGIAPPVKGSNSKPALFGETIVSCPKCGSQTTEKLSEFGSTPCKAHYRCMDCLEPFDYFKCI